MLARKGSAKFTSLLGGSPEVKAILTATGFSWVRESLKLLATAHADRSGEIKMKAMQRKEKNAPSFITTDAF